MVLLNQEQIKDIIPHREPFLLVDEVTGLEPGVKCIARTFIEEDAFWFKGHFPSYPVTPGVLIIEMLAQTGAICVGSLPEYSGKIAFFSKADKVKFRRQVLPGEQLTLEVDMVRLRKKVGVGKCVARVDDEIACTAELTFMFQE